MKYRVLKEFVSPTGVLVTPDSQPIDDLSYPMMTETLIKNGFIVEIKDGAWKPKFGDTYYYISSCGDMYSEGHFTSANIHDYGRLAMGNCFQTEKQAEKARDWLRAFKTLRDDARGFKPNWLEPKGWPKMEKFYVMYSHESKVLFYVTSTDDYQGSLIYFATKEDAKESIKNHPKEWLTYFGIEQEEQE